jgi:hypothetical protein
MSARMSSALNRLRVATRRNAGLLAIAAIGVAYAVPVQYIGWNEGAHYAEVRAFAEGTPYIDQTRFEVGKGGMDDQGLGDVSLIDGHYVAAKSPGLAFAAVVPYLLLRAGGDAKPIRESRPNVWFLMLWTSLLPAVLLLVLVRTLTDRLEPGFGTIAAVTLGGATMVLPFATMFFSHVLSATLAFSAFALLWWERRGPPSLALLLLAGLLAGLGVSVEYPIAVIGTVLGVYAIARSGTVMRAVAYSAGAAIGCLPALLFNAWAFGSVFTFPYANVVGQSGANKAGLFGVTTPSVHTLAQLLFASIGLITLTPVVVLGAAGLVLLYRRGRRGEAAIAAAVCLAYLLLNAGYETPFGGDSPGPRFLVATLPFLALGLPSAYRRLPLTTAALALVSCVQMAALTLTDPILATQGGWFGRVASGKFVETTTGLMGIPHVAVPLFVAALLTAATLAVVASGPFTISRRDALAGVLALGAWLLLAHVEPRLLDHDDSAAALGLAAGLMAVVALVSLRTDPSERVERPPVW